MLGIVAVGIVRESRKFRASIYRAHRAVIFVTAQLSCNEIIWTHLTIFVSQYFIELEHRTTYSVNVNDPVRPKQVKSANVVFTFTDFFIFHK